MTDRSSSVIVGIGQTEFSKNSGRSELQLACEAIRAALDDCGLSPADVNGMTTFTLDSSDDVDLVRALGIENLRFSSRVPHGGGGANGTLAHAMAAVDSGLADVVVGWRAMNERSEARFGTAQMTDTQGAKGSGTGFVEWSVPFGAVTPASWTALQAQRYMHKYGATNEDFGRVSVLLRRAAATNPRAFFYQRPLSLEEHQASRWIAEPVFRLFDCCQESDGGVAFVVTTRERARDCAQAGAAILHATQAVPFETEVVTNFYHADLTRFDSGISSAQVLYERTGLGPDDIQVGMLYDHFTVAVYWHLEAFGFCGPGEGPDFIREGHGDLDGRLALSPNGGLIGEAYIHGMNNITEAVRQIRGTAVNQVESVDHVLLSSGMSAAILGRA